MFQSFHRETLKCACNLLLTRSAQAGDLIAFDPQHVFDILLGDGANQNRSTPASLTIKPL